MSDFYCTSFCNKAHRLSDGKPLDHVCYVLKPHLLGAEYLGATSFEEPMPVEPRRVHTGIRIRRRSAE